MLCQKAKENFPAKERAPDMIRILTLAAMACALAPSGWAERDGLLAAHNELRARHGSAPLVWSENLAKGAQGWADACVFEHATGPYGENLSWWQGGNDTPADRVRDWYSEIKDFDFAAPDRNDYSVTGHFTQIVWRGSRELGCGVSVCSGGAKMLVCRYSPPGNVDGRYRENVPKVK
jgi:uncharacterized protein YkwD